METVHSRLLDSAVSDDGKMQCAVQPSTYWGCGLWECVEELFLLLSSPLSHSSAELLSLQARAALLPGGLPLAPQQGISGASVSTLKWCVLTNHYSEKYNNTLELSQSCCSNACV